MVRFQFLTSSAMFIQFFLVLVVRYFSIFHSHIIMEMNETKLIQKSRGFLAMILATFLTFDVISEGSSHGPLFNLLVYGECNQFTDTNYYANRPAKHFILRILVTVDFILMVILQVRAEHENFKLAKNQIRLENTSQTNAYDKGTIRTVICFGAMALAILILSPWNYASLIQVRTRSTIFGLLAFNIIPIIFIYRNENMKTYLLSKCALWITSVFAPGRLEDIP